MFRIRFIGGAVLRSDLDFVVVYVLNSIGFGVFWCLCLVAANGFRFRVCVSFRFVECFVSVLGFGFGIRVCLYGVITVWF